MSTNLPGAHESAIVASSNVFSLQGHSVSHRGVPERSDVLLFHIGQQLQMSNHESVSQKSQEKARPNSCA